MVTPYELLSRLASQNWTPHGKWLRHPRQGRPRSAASHECRQVASDYLKMAANMDDDTLGTWWIALKVCWARREVQ
jgi:hypothetical protein